MAHGRDHRRLTGKNCPGHFFLIESPQILHGTAAPTHNDNVHTVLVQNLDSFYDTVHRSLALNQRRIENQLDEGIPPPRDIHDIPDGRSR